jgi:hypothetical protein
MLTEPEPEPVADPDSVAGFFGQSEREAAALESAPQPEPLAVAPEAEPDREPEVPAQQPEPTPAPVAAAVQEAPPDVSSTIVAWPSSSPARGGNGSAATNPPGFEEATSIIPAWQHAPADSKRTVSLQALPPEQLASGGGFAALLTFESGPFAGRIVALPSQMVSIGRAPDNDVVVGDPATSGHHGRIEVRTGSFWIGDLGSTNGTQVNGEPVIEKQLADGDLIAIGQNTMRFTLEA